MPWVANRFRPRLYAERAVTDYFRLIMLYRDYRLFWSLATAAYRIFRRLDLVSRLANARAVFKPNTVVSSSELYPYSEKSMQSPPPAGDAKRSCFRLTGALVVSR